jgi:CheY-like chemotaxis protein
MTGSVHRLQPLRVLLCGRDRRFLRVTSFLLSRRGYDVAQASAREAVKRADDQRSDVVLLEPSESRAETARTIAALQTSAASPALLILFEDGDGTQWNGLSTAYKWTPVEKLIEKVEAAALHRMPPGVAGMPLERGTQSL